MKTDLVDHLHIRKINKNKEYITKIINSLYKIDRPRIVMHSNNDIANHYQLGGLHHKSNSEYDPKHKTEYQTKAFHSIEEIKACKHPYKYGFLSPIFDSISKEGYKAKFDLEELKTFLHSGEKPFPIIALGGIEPSNISQVKELGFDGVAILGAFWRNMFLEKKLSVLREIRELL